MPFLVKFMEKKSLNFDFLDESPKQTGEKTTESVATTSASAPVGKVGFFHYLKECYIDFNTFCKKYLASKNPPYLLILIWFFGIGSASDRLIGSIQDY